MNQPFDLGMGDIAHVSCSIGIALYPDNGEDSDELMQHADQAMYVVKQGGRNGFCYFTQNMQQQAEEKINLTHDLHGALERGELEVYYQPIIEMTNRRIEKAEALLRWHHPHRGMVSPAVFIPLAEESGLILSIGAWVVDQTVQAIKDWHEATGQWIPVSVNKSPVQFARDEHMDWLQRFEQSDLPRHILTIEITEGLLLNPSTRVRDKFELFRLHDIELSIDDFGTGYSALSYLNQFDVDYLKIDRSFVQNLVTDATNRALTEAIIVMAHKLGIRTIAEGVETEEQYQLLKDFGCDYAQGFLLARPLPFSQFMERISLPSDHVPVPVP